MAEAAAQPPAAAAESAAPKKGLPIKTIGIVAAVMVLEAGAVFMVVSMASKKPDAAAAAELHHEVDDGEALVELPLIEDKFQNMQTGRAWIWDVTIFLKVKKKHEEFVHGQLEARAAEVKEGISLIFRRATHAQLKEPGLESVNRLLTTYINEIIEPAPDGTSRIERVILPKCRGFPAD